MPSHGVARCRTESHAVASFGGYCEDSGGFCQNRASGGPLDKQVYSLDFLNGSREPCGAEQAPRGGRKGPPGSGDVEIAARPAGASRPVDRGRDTPWTTRGVAHRLPPPLPTGCPAFPTFPLPAACGRDRRRNFDFFSNPSPGLPPLRASLAPFRCRTGTGGGAGEAGGTPSGVPPGGRRGGRKAGQGGGTPPPLGGPAYPPLGGFWRGRGSRPKGGGTPSGGAPRSVFDRAKNAALIDLRERKPGILKNQWVKGGGRVTAGDPGSGHQL